MSDQDVNSAPTLFLLMAQYNGQTVVPLDRVCRDFFGHLTVEKLLRKALRGDIALPIVRIETSQKAQRGVHLFDLAAYIDKRRAAAVKECRQLCEQDSGNFRLETAARCSRQVGRYDIVYLNCVTLCRSRFNSWRALAPPGRRSQPFLARDARHRGTGREPNKKDCRAFPFRQRSRSRLAPSP
jgi:Pyocin activator protein PrtN